VRDKATHEQIVEAADRLFYRRGYEHTSFADIAGVVRISRGNFYHHFKAKDEILSAVIEARLKDTRRMLAEWELAGDDPTERIRSFIRILITNRADIERYGCPVGTLCVELAKLRHAALGEATALFEVFRGWLSRQFTLLGRVADADRLALHLLARSQGVAVLANVVHDQRFIEDEVRQMDEWVKSCTKGRTRRAAAGGRARARKNFEQPED
jgi:TetR/AcrR family transcriptional regulator, transcriptional repressor for nem operon